MSFICIVVVSEAQDHMFRFDAMFLHQRKGLCARMQMVKNMETGTKREIRRAMHVFEV